MQWQNYLKIQQPKAFPIWVMGLRLGPPDYVEVWRNGSKFFYQAVSLCH